MKKRVITISREFGSGGHSIGKIVAETLGIGFYDQELLDKIAEETGQIWRIGQNVFLNDTEIVKSPSKSGLQIKIPGGKSTIRTTQTVRGAYHRTMIYALTVVHWGRNFV